MDNLFIEATRKAWRFPSNKGELNLEQLWQLPLTHKTGFDLDTMARTLNTELKSFQEESFVKPIPKVGHTEAQSKLEIVKAIIAIKLDEAAETGKRQLRLQERRKLIDALAAAEARELSIASKEELLKKLSEIDGD